MHPLIARIRKSVTNASPTVPEASLTAAEASLGLELPSLMRDLYLHVGDGGFGPGYGILPLYTDDPEHALVKLTLEFRRGDPDEPTWHWPPGFVLFCDWGCAIYSCVDCTSPEGAVFTFEHVPDEPMSESLILTRDSLESFLSDWLDGKDVSGPLAKTA